MRVKTKNVSFNVGVCDSFFRKMKGFMFSSSPVNDGLIFIFSKEVSVSLHMLFVFFPLDVVYLNEKKVVVEIKKKVKPFSLYVSGPKAKYVLELKSAKGLKVGEVFSFH